MRYTRQNSTNQVIIIKYSNLFVYINSGRKPATADRTSTSVNRTGEDSLQNGSLPKSLQQLVPAFIDTTPVDPFSGQPFIYRVEKTGYALYSVGPDGVDDGGEPIDRSTEMGDLSLVPRPAAEKKTESPSQE